MEKQKTRKKDEASKKGKNGKVKDTKRQSRRWKSEKIRGDGLPRAQTGLT